MDKAAKSNTADSVSPSRKRPYVCSECGKAYTSQGYLEQHCRKQHQRECQKGIHCGKKMIKALCGICNEESRADRLFYHMTTFHNQTFASTCEECGVEVQPGSITKHLTEVHGAVKCLLCCRKFASLNAYATHFNNLHCSRASTSDSLNKRKKSESKTGDSNRDMVCGICEQSFQYGKLLYRHLLKHTVKIRSDMDICGRCWGVVPQIEVLAHMQECRVPMLQTETSIDSKSRFVCSECGLAYGSNRSMKRHIEDTHEKNELLHSKDFTASSEDPSPIPESLPVVQPAGVPVLYGVGSPEASADSSDTENDRSEATFSTCERCGEKVSSARPFQYQLDAHDGSVCHCCPQKLAPIHSPATHSAADCGNLPLICGICEHTFIEIPRFYRHILQHSVEIADDEEACLYCGTVVPAKEISKHNSEYEREVQKMRSDLSIHSSSERSPDDQAFRF